MSGGRQNRCSAIWRRASASWILAAICLVALGDAFAGQAPAVAPDPTSPPARMLIVGNSYVAYNGGVHRELQHIVQAARPDR